MADLHSKILQLLESLPVDHEIFENDHIDKLIEEIERIKKEKELTIE